MMLVKDLMVPVTDKWLSPEITLYEAVCVMQQTESSGESHVNGMLVLENGANLVGILSIKDVVRAVIPKYMEKNLRSFAWDGMLEEYARKAKQVNVSTIMSRILITIGPADSLMRCADLMINNRLQRLPVVDDSGRVLGVIHIQNLYEHIADLICSGEEE